MDAWWIGTVSTLAGAVTAAILTALRERTAHQRQLRTRWDETLLVGLVDYLSTADRAVRALMRWRFARDEGISELDIIKAEALGAFEQLHEKSQVVTLLTGGYENPLREAARGMRAPLESLRQEVAGISHLDGPATQALIEKHRDARTLLIHAAQRRLGVIEL